MNLELHAKWTINSINKPFTTYNSAVLSLKRLSKIQSSFNVNQVFFQQLQILVANDLIYIARTWG
jgi:hypothetical protein